MIIVTSYVDPDLDGIACSIAYAQLLSLLGKKSQATYCGQLGLEVDFVKTYTNYFPIKKHQGNYDSISDFVLVDTADPDSLESAIDLNKVIEVFDHRQLVTSDHFPRAKKTIELVGSCATLISQQFKINHQTPSPQIATYLYSAIISNTINLKNSITTQRDIVTASWLKSLTSLPSNYTKQMFSAKSSITANNFYQIIDQDFATKTIRGYKIGIAQLEIVNLQKTLTKLSSQLIDILQKLKKDNNLDYVFFTGIDILQGYNIFYTIDSESTGLFAQALGITNLKSPHQTNSIIMRKQIWPQLESTFKASSS